jgi:hypothetical protein
MIVDLMLSSTLSSKRPTMYRVLVQDGGFPKSRSEGQHQAWLAISVADFAIQDNPWGREIAQKRLGVGNLL